MPLKDKEARSEYQKAWYSQNKPRLLSNRKRYYGAQANVRKLLNAAKQRAKQKGWEFNITVEDLDIPEVCPVLGEPLIKHTRYAPSIDRLDSTKGYTKDNVWIISRRANLMKNDATIEDLKRFAEWVRRL